MYGRKPSQPEVNSGIPLEGGPRTQRPPTVEEMMKLYIRRELSAQAASDGNDTFDDFDDFSEDNPDTLPVTHHEVVAMDPEELQDYALDAGLELVSDEARQVPQEGAASPQQSPTGTQDSASAPAQTAAPEA